MNILEKSDNSIARGGLPGILGSCQPTLDASHRGVFRRIPTVDCPGWRRADAAAAELHGAARGQRWRSQRRREAFGQVEGHRTQGAATVTHIV